MWFKSVKLASNRLVRVTDPMDVAIKQLTALECSIIDTVLRKKYGTATDAVRAMNKVRRSTKITLGVPGGVTSS